MDTDFENHLQNTVPEFEEHPTLLAHIKTIPSHSMKEQFTLLGTISNFHHYPYPSQRKNNLIINPKHVTYSEHLLHDESETISQEEKVRKYIPTSPRNQIMYFMCCNQEKSSELHHLIKHLLLCDMHGKDKGTIAFHEDMSQPPPEKKKIIFLCIICKYI